MHEGIIPRLDPHATETFGSSSAGTGIAGTWLAATQKSERQ